LITKLLHYFYSVFVFNVLYWKNENINSFLKPKRFCLSKPLSWASRW